MGEIHQQGKKNNNRKQPLVSGPTGVSLLNWISVALRTIFPGGATPLQTSVLNTFWVVAHLQDPQHICLICTQWPTERNHYSTSQGRPPIGLFALSSHFFSATGTARGLMTAANTQWAIVAQQIIGFNYPTRCANPCGSIASAGVQKQAGLCVCVCVSAHDSNWLFKNSCVARKQSTQTGNKAGKQMREWAQDPQIRLICRLMMRLFVVYLIDSDYSFSSTNCFVA